VKHPCDSYNELANMGIYLWKKWKPQRRPKSQNVVTVTATARAAPQMA